ncbi:MAG: ribonuclease H family protein [Bacteroidales bacterium]|jgi:ribonuclease HI|nr:ribonuclease H family protein [Bacteroidales bacterium]
MKKEKFYVVWQGRKPGIYRTWEKCLEQVEKHEGAKYKSFTSLAEAEKAFREDYGKYIKKNTQKTIPGEIKLAEKKPEMKSWSVDAAWNTKTGIMEYRGVETETGREIFHKGPYEDATNNIGEFLAVVHALALLKKKGINIPVYSDSSTAIKWVNDKKTKTKLIPSDKNAEIFDLINRAESWLQKNNYSNPLLKWDTKIWGEIPADFGRK